MRIVSYVVAAAVGSGVVAAPRVWAHDQSAPAAFQVEPPSLVRAQHLFYNARYDEASAVTVALRASSPNDLAIAELHTSAMLFQLKALLEKRPNGQDPPKTCPACPGLIADFLAETHRGQALARAALAANPADDTALFFLGKLDLNYVWLQLGPLHRKTGWDEYWEARRSLDAVLARGPGNVRARVARAWIDYIVDTKMPWGTRWLLGGGNRKQALIDVRAAVRIETDFYTHAEAEFALWNMEMRERDVPRATQVAERLAADFPDNREIAAFIEAHSPRPLP